VPSRRRDLERTTGPLVPTHLGKVGERSLGCGGPIRLPLPPEVRLAAQVGDGFGEVAHGDRLDARERGFGGRIDRTQQLVDCGASGSLRDREHAADTAQPPVEAQLAHGSVVGEALGGDLTRRSEDRERDRQVEGRPFLPQLRRREVDRDAAVRPIELCGGDAAPDSVLRLLHRAVDEPDDGEAGNASLDVHLDVDAPRLETDEGVRDRVREHVATLDDRR
jgi:hypothetical protein